MKKLFLLILALYTAQPAFAQNTWTGALLPNKAPADSIGREADWFLDSSSLKLWGPKTSGFWGPVRNPPTYTDLRSYGAQCDGVTDDRAAIASAALAASAIGGLIIVPSGTCVINTDGGSITTNNVTFVGSGVSDTFLLTPTKGSIFAIKGTTNAPFSMKTGSSFQGITFFYPDQINSATPVVYPATLKLDTSANVQNININNNTFVNSYDAIDLTTGGGPNGGIGEVNIIFNKIDAGHRGIIIPWNVDVIKIVGNTFSLEFWNTFNETGWRAFYRQNSYAIEYSRGDGLWVAQNVFFGNQRGFSMNVATGTFIDQLSVVGNLFDQVQYGFYLTGAGNFIRSSISNNSFYSARVPNGVIDTTNLGYSFYADSTGTGGVTDDFILTNNNYEAATGDSLFFGGTATRKLIVANSAFSSMGASQISGTYAALRVNNANTSVQFNGNQVTCGANALTNGVYAEVANVLHVQNSLFTSCNSVVHTVSNVIIHTGNSSFGTVGATSDVIAATNNIPTGNLYDKPSGSTTLPYVFARKPTGQTLTGNTPTDIPFTTVDYNKDSGYSSPTYTATRSGEYEIRYTLTQDNTGTAGNRVVFTIISTSNSNLLYTYTSLANFNTFSFGGTIYMAKGDTVKLQGQIAQGAGTFTNFNDGTYNFMSIKFIE